MDHTAAQQAVAQLSPVFIETITAIIGACLVFIAARAHQYISKMNISETFKKDLFATNDQIMTSLKKVVATTSEELRQKLADGKLDSNEMAAIQEAVYKDVKAQIPDLEERLNVHMKNGGQYIADTILGGIESGNKVTAL